MHVTSRYVLSYGVSYNYEGHTESNEHIYPTLKQRYTYKNK